MRKILYVICGLEYSGAAKQLALLLRGLPRDEFDVRVCALGDDGPAADLMRATGAAVDALGGTRLFNLAALWSLRRLVRAFRPDVIHTWGQASLRAVALTVGRAVHALVASAPFAPGKDLQVAGRLDRWLLRRVDQVLVNGPSAAARCRNLGLAPNQVVIVPPGIDVWSAPRSALGAPRSAVRARRTIVCAGPLEAHKGFLDAIWGYDILHYLFADLHLLLAGTGPDRIRLERFVEQLQAGERVHFVGAQPNVGELLAEAEVVWVPSRAEGGVNVALEAMALGRPVVASRLPGLAEIIADGQTGLLFTPGNKVELGRQTRRLLENPALCRQLGDAGRCRAATHFAATDFVRRCADLYGPRRQAA
jgi:glycosyltransferase involved in cell wall biosynthesis